MLTRLFREVPFFKKSPRPLPSSEKQQDSADTTDLDDFLESARCVAKNAQLDPQTRKRIADLSHAFPVINNKKGLQVIVFHVSGPTNTKIDFRDVKMDLSRFDYGELLHTFILATLKARADTEIILVTQLSSEFRTLARPNVHIVELPLNPEFPMYERVVAMCSYVHSEAFKTNTVFLDSDAFLTKDPSAIFDAGFDIALTFRDAPGLMPINEGVIFASATQPQAVQRFFRNYLATYDALITNNTVTSYYGDIRTWRGGQLSLNAQVTDAQPFSPYREYGTTQGTETTRIRFLPCEIFNYSFEYGDRLVTSDVESRFVLHLKGGRKNSLEQTKLLLKLNASDTANLNFVAPHFATFNKMYSAPPLTDEPIRKVFLQNLLSAAGMLEVNKSNSGAFLADDSFVWFRNLGFLNDINFIEAFKPYSSDAILRARIWRIYTLCWAAHSCLSLPGHFIDVGCYDGKTVDVISRYTNFPTSNKRYYLYDLFDEPPKESLKSGHGPLLFNQVRSLFANRPSFQVIKGLLPESFSQGLPDQIAFAQIDLNAAEPEIACLEILFDRMTPGGIIILDDFGFSRYRETHLKETEFFSKRNHLVFEIPTGQGLVIKRS